MQLNDSMNIKKPEILAPAGDLEKLKFAIDYGADAVYLAGQNYGLRAKTKNFDYDSMKEGIEYAHTHNAFVYITMNIFAHNQDLINIEQYLENIEKMNVDAVIISDLGIFCAAKKILKNTKIHISTQANTTNYLACNSWHELGASRIVLARELSLDEISQICQKSNKDLEIEVFVHGSMCMSYSGRCLLSNYMSSRDANRGGCSQSCRWKYKLVEETRPGEYMPIYEDERGTYIFNSRDLCMINYLDEITKTGIKSLKIEGRMKSPYYVATVVKAYREAIDDLFENIDLYKSKLEYYLDEVSKNSHRKFSTGLYFEKSNENSQIYEDNSYIKTHEFVGIVLDYDEENKLALIEQRNKFVVGDTIEFFTKKGPGFKQKLSKMYDLDGKVIYEAPHAQQLIKIEVDTYVSKSDILRINKK